jgi:hypothetical protein
LHMTSVKQKKMLNYDQICAWSNLHIETWTWNINGRKLIFWPWLRVRSATNVYVFFSSMCINTLHLLKKEKLVANSYSLIDDFLSLLEGELNFDDLRIRTQFNLKRRIRIWIRPYSEARSGCTTSRISDQEQDWIRI